MKHRSLHAMLRVICPLLLLSATQCCAAQTRIATVHIRVVQGGGARPVKRADTITTVFPLNPYTLPIEKIGDKQGAVAVLVPTEGQITLAVANHAGCRHISKADRAKGPERISLETILNTGVVDTNGCKVHSTSPTPGELVFFVRGLHWWERLRD